MEDDILWFPCLALIIIIIITQSAQIQSAVLFTLKYRNSQQWIEEWRINVSIIMNKENSTETRNQNGQKANKENHHK